MSRKSVATPSRNPWPIRLFWCISILAASIYVAIFFAANRIAPFVAATHGTGILDIRGEAWDSTSVRVQKTVKPNSKVFEFPISAIIDLNNTNHGPVGQLLNFDNGATLRHMLLLLRTKIPGQYHLLFWATRILHERRRGPSSQWHGWFSMLPDIIPGCLTWPASFLPCLDSATRNGTYILTETTVLAETMLNQMMNNQTIPVDLRRSVFVDLNRNVSLAEVTWAMMFFLKSNLQDQAILPIWNLARVSNEKAGLGFRFDRDSNQIILTAPQGAKQGEELVVNYLQGPGRYLMAHSKALSAPKGIDANVNVPTETSGAREYCILHYAALQFDIGGTPKAPLLNCVAVNLASGPERKRLLKSPTSEKSGTLLQKTYEQLASAAREELKHIDEILSDATCNTLEPQTTYSAIKQTSLLLQGTLRLAVRHCDFHAEKFRDN